MFGSVPKNLWSKRLQADEQNRILLATRSFLIQHESRSVLVDAGLGQKWSERMRDIYDVCTFSFEQALIIPEQITDIIITHLHFDHAGGLSRRRPGSPELELVFPEARLHIHRANWELASQPSLKERASYLRENIQVLKGANLRLIDQSGEIYPDLLVHRTDGHSRGQLWVEVRDGSRSFVVPGDIIPTSHHLPVPYTTGLDMNAEALVQDKENLLRKALEQNWIIAFQHDTSIEAATVARDEKGHFCISQSLDVGA